MGKPRDAICQITMDLERAGVTLQFFRRIDAELAQMVDQAELNQFHRLHAAIGLLGQPQRKVLQVLFGVVEVLAPQFHTEKERAEREYQTDEDAAADQQMPGTGMTQ